MSPTRRVPGRWEAPLTLAVEPSEVFSVAISPNGRLLAASDYAGMIQLWDISDPDAPEAARQWPEH